MLKIASIGECLIELSGYDGASGTMRATVAGDTLNTAIYLARLLPRDSFSVSYITTLGHDQFSDLMISRMRTEGIDTALVGRHQTRLPGLYAIELDDQGERSFRYWREASAARTLFSCNTPTFDALDEFDIIYLSSITLAILPPRICNRLIKTCRDLKGRGKGIAFDSNYRPRLWPDVATARDTMAAMWQATSTALPSRDDEALLYPDETPDQLIKRLVDAGASEIVMKNGDVGPTVWASGLVDCGPFEATGSVVDTTGAGDSFNAGYLAARFQNLPPAEAAQRGHALASCVIGAPGAILPHSTS